MMKKGIALFISILLLLGSACAEVLTVDTPFDAVKMSFDVPDGYAVEQHIANDLAIVDLIPSDALGLEYHIVVSRSDFEGAEEVSLTDLTEEQIRTMAEQSAGESEQMEHVEHILHTLDNGMLVLSVHETQQLDEYTAAYALIRGYLIGVRVDRHMAGLPIAMEDHQLLLNLFESMNFVVE